jgi:hypothetical protein
LNSYSITPTASVSPVVSGLYKYFTFTGNGTITF